MATTDITVPETPTITGLSKPVRGNLTRDDLFDVLSNPRRRCALYYLQREGGAVALQEVVDYVTAWQYDQPLSELDAGDRMCVYSALHQVHLPRLDEAGFVEYDRNDRTIEVRDELEYARLYLEYDPGNDIPWSGVYAGLVGVGTLLAGASALAIYPFDWLTGSRLAIVILLTFAVAVLVHTIATRRNRLELADLFEVRP